MKTVKLDCAACGAPVSIPEGVETVICPSCSTTLTVDRGEGGISLKVLEKLTDAIRENAFVTQTEMRRMQINQMISLDEMRLNTLQGEFRTAKRNAPAGVPVSVEMVDILLSLNDVRMHIRALLGQLAKLDPNWKESLEVFQADVNVLNQAVQELNPYAKYDRIEPRLVQMQQLLNQALAAYNQLEAKILKCELESLNYPPFGRLTLEQMEELIEKIPDDLAKLRASPRTPVREQFIGELTTTLKKIQSVYPRRKLESQTGKLASLNYAPPYPESPQALRPMISQLQTDIERVQTVPQVDIKNHFMKVLKEKLDLLTARAAQDIPAARKRKKKRKTIIAFSALGLAAVCVTIFVIAIVTDADGSRGEQTSGNESTPLLVNLAGREDLSEGEKDGVVPGQFEEYVTPLVEVIASATFLRESPSLDSDGTVKVVQGDILLNLEEDGLPSSWYHVSTWDGSATGYLAIDWITPFTVEAVPGDALPAGMQELSFEYDCSEPLDYWQAETFDDEYAYGYSDFYNGEYQLEITSKDQACYQYVNQIITDLPEDFLYRMSFDSVNMGGNAYYGLQTNYIDGATFDSVLIGSDGSLNLVAFRETSSYLLYSTADTVNTTAVLNPEGMNVLSMTRTIDTGHQTVAYAYALNGQVFVQMTLDKIDELKPQMGYVVFLNETGDTATILMDDFQVYK